MEKKSKFIIRQIWIMTNPSKIQFGFGLVLSIVSGILSLFIPLLIRDIMDSLGKALPIQTIIIIVILLIFEVILSAFSLYYLAKVGEQIVKNLRIKLWDKLLRLPVKFYNENKSGEMVSRLTSDTTAIVNIISNEIVNLISSAITLFLSIIILFTLDAPMTLVLIIVAPLTIFVVIPLGTKIYELSFLEQDKLSKLTAYLTQTLSGIKLVKAYNNEARESLMGTKHFNYLYQNGLSRAKINSILTPVLGIFSTVVLIGVIGFGAWRVDQGFISTGELVAFLLYLFQIITPFVQMNTFVTSLQEAKGAMKRLIELLNEEEEVLHIANEVKVKFPTQLEFKNVFFGYDVQTTILKDISFKIKKGSVTALIGPSGVGKSTVFSLLERFYYPISGDILLDNISYQHIPVDEWRRNFSYVSQDISLFSGTIRENILYGKDNDIDEHELIKYSKLAYAHEFIENLPNGYDTEVGEFGNQLSGGQKQRIAIARALIRDSHFLLLDEATANLDSDSEEQVQQAINSLINKHTTFVIAHRLSTIINADQIIILEEGKITGIGTHNELIISHDYYKKAIKQQFERKAHN